MGDTLFKTPEQKSNINSLVDDKKYAERFDKLEKVLQTQKVSAEDAADAFNDHGDELLEGIRDDMLMNFDKIDKEEGPQLTTYEAAYQAFETDIKTLTEQSKVTEKVEEKETEEEKVSDDIYATSSGKQETGKTPKYIEKLDKLIAIIQEIKYIIRLKKLEQGKDPGVDFDAGKLQLFINKTEYFKENSPKESGTTRESLITAKDEEVLKEKETAAKTEKDKLSVQETLNTNRTEETAKNFFEAKGNEAKFNAVFDYMGTISTGDLCEYKTPADGDKTKEQHRDNFVELLSLYLGEEVTSVKLEKASGSDTYMAGKRIVVCKYSYTEKIDGKETTKTEEREITFGSQDQMQKDRAEAFQETDPNLKLAKDNPLTQFDGKGNYRAFEKYIKTEKGGKEFADNFKHVVDAILTYKKPTDTTNADSIENENDLKNGYANALTDYVLSVHPALSKRYISYLTPDNLNILGTNKETRLANLAKLGKSTAFMNSLTEDEEKIISDVFISASETKKTTLQDAINNMSNLIVGLMTMFGFGKGTLKKRFPSMANQIDQIYNQEFKLDPKEIECIKKIKEDGLSKNPNEKRVKDGTYIVPKADEIKESMSKWTISNKLVTNYKEYLSFIDPKILKKGITLYNEAAEKDGKDKITQSDFVMTKNGKLEINIKGIEKNPDTFKIIIQALLDSDETRKIIATANANIRKTTTVKVKDNTIQMSEYFTDTSDRKFNVIKSSQDAAAFFGAYLFAGSKSVAYTVTENNLVKSKGISEDTDTPEKLATYTINEKTILYQTNDITKTTEVESGATVTATKEKTLKTGKILGLTGENDTEFRQVTLADGKTIGWIKTAAMKETAVVTNESKKLNIDTKYATVSADGIYTLTAAVEPEDVKIHNIFTGTLPETLKFTSKSTGKESTITKGKDPKDNTTDTYLDKNKKRVMIHEGDKIEAIPEIAPETIDKKRTAINTELIKDNVKTAKTTFEGSGYTLDENNLYQQQIANLSNMFTGSDYLTLISEVSNTTLNTMVKENMSHLKNMFSFRNLQILSKNAAYTKSIASTLTNEQLGYITPEKQTYELKEAKDNSITITVSKNKYESGKDAKEGTINITKDANGVLSVTWTDKPAEKTEQTTA